MNKHIITIDTEKCIGCNQCKKDCPVGNIVLKDKKAVVLSQTCSKCGHCVAVCPKAAVSITGFSQPPVEIQRPTMLDPQQLLSAIRTRRSVRQFQNKPIATEIIADIIEAGRWTPTAQNAQDVSYIVLSQDIKRYEAIGAKLVRLVFPIAKRFSAGIKNAVIENDFFFKSAPVAIMVLSKNKINASLAASNMELMAQAHGLGVLYSGLFSIAANISPKLKKALNLTKKDHVVTTLVLGYPNVNYHRTAQREEAVVRYQ